MYEAVIGVLGDAPETVEIFSSPPVSVVRLPASDVTGWPTFAARASHALVVGEHRQELEIRHHAAVAADLGLATAWRSVLLGPMAIVTAARAASLVARTADGAAPGLLPARFDETVRGMWNAAWVPRVTKLDHPAPTLLQHLRSWLPLRDGYLATLTGSAGVERVSRPRPAGPASLARATLLRSDGQLPSRALALALARAGSAGSEPLAADRTVGGGAAEEYARLARERFGPGAVELLALPTAVGYRAAGPLVTCVACGADVPAGFCPYCRVRPTPGPAAADPAAPTAETATPTTEPPTPIAELSTPGV